MVARELGVDRTTVAKWFKTKKELRASGGGVSSTVVNLHNRGAFRWIADQAALDAARHAASVWLLNHSQAQAFSSSIGIAGSSRSTLSGSPSAMKTRSNW